MKIAKYLHYIEERGVYLLLFLLPWQTRLFLNSSATEYGQISLYVLDFLLITLILLFVPEFVEGLRNSTKKSLNKWSLGYSMAVLITWSLMSSMWAPDQSVTLFKTLLIFKAVLLFWLVTRTFVSHYKASIAFIAGALVQAGVGIWQFLAQSAQGSKWLGMATHVPATLVASVVEYADERWLRAYGALPHPNILGGLLAVALFVLLGLLLSKHKTTWSPLSETLFFYGSAVVLTAGLFFSFSRSAWLALALGMLLIFISIRSVTTSQRWQLGKVTLVIMVTFTVLTFTYLPLFYTRITGTTRLEHKSTIERIDSALQARSIIHDNWLQGVGAGNYTQVIVRAGASPAPTEFRYIQPVHNTWLLILAELGAIGLALILVTGYGLLVTFRENSFKSSLLHTTPLLALLIISLFDHYLWSLSVGLLLAATTLALSLKSLQNS